MLAFYHCDIKKTLVGRHLSPRRYSLKLDGLAAAHLRIAMLKISYIFRSDFSAEHDLNGYFTPGKRAELILHLGGQR